MRSWWRPIPGRTQPAWLAAAAATWVIYATSFRPLLETLGGTAGALSLIPVVVTGLALGAFAGIGAGLLAIGANAVLFTVSGHGGFHYLVASGALVPLLSLPLIGAVVGRLADMRAQLHTRLNRLRETETRLLQSQRRFGALVEGTAEMLLVCDYQGTILSVNAAARQALGYEEQELVGQPLGAIEQEGWEGRFRLALSQLLAGDHVTIESRYGCRDGRTFPVEIKTALISYADLESDAETPAVLATVRDTSEQQRYEELMRKARIDLEQRVRERTTALSEANERLQQLARFDTLTGVANRAYFRENAERALAQAERTGSQGALMYVDLGRFKAINDTLGHGAGDQALQIVADRLRSSLRRGDFVGRLGGDEFAVLVENMDRVSDVAVVAQKVIAMVGERMVLSGSEAYVPASVGITLFPEDGDTYEQLIANSDIAMYTAKRHRRGTYQFYAPDMHEQSVRRAGLETALRTALEREELTLFYQPQIRLADGCVVAAEALLRWNSQERGSVSPAEFIPIAEQAGLIVPIGEWVMRQACSDASSWNASGLEGVRVAVNLSPAQFRQAALTQRIAQHLDDAGLDAKLLELELTESLLMTDTEASASTLAELQEMGIPVAIDDFGTGYSSLSYLQRFPLNSLKIDQSFVGDIGVGEEAVAITSTIVDLAHSLGLTVVAEGVETEQQLAVLRDRQCEVAQGFYFSKALPFDEFIEFASSRLPEGAVRPERDTSSATLHPLR